MKKTAVFLMSLLAPMLTVALYAHLLFDLRIFDGLSLAKVLNLFPNFKAACEALGISFWPSLLYAILMIFAVPAAYRRGKWRGALAALYALLWMACAYWTASAFSYEFGNTWAPSEIILELIISSYFAVPLLFLGLLLQVFVCHGWFGTAVNGQMNRRSVGYTLALFSLLAAMAEVWMFCSLFDTAGYAIEYIETRQQRLLLMVFAMLLLALSWGFAAINRFRQKSLFPEVDLFELFSISISAAVVLAVAVLAHFGTLHVVVPLTLALASLVLVFFARSGMIKE